MLQRVFILENSDKYQLKNIGSGKHGDWAARGHIMSI